MIDAVDPELRAALADWPPAARGIDALLARRAALDAMLSGGAPPVPGVTVRSIVLPGPAGAPDVSVILHAPDDGDARPLLLHFHGGGFVFGRAAMSVATNAARALALDCVVASVEYRLAPETRAPGAAEDGHAALRGLHARADAFGIDPARIAVGGESAGGGIAAAVALIARDRGGPALCHQSLRAPMLDDRTNAMPERARGAGRFVWGVAENAFAWGCALGEGSDVHPCQAPARASNFAGLPPAYLDVGALDLFRDEGMAYAQALMRAGVACELHVLPGAYHGFERVGGAGIVRRVDAARDAALRRAWGTLA